MFADRKVGTENPDLVLRQRQQVGDLLVGAPHESFSQSRPDKKSRKPLIHGVRSRQLPLELEQFPDGKLFWRQVLQIVLYFQDT